MQPHPLDQPHVSGPSHCLRTRRGHSRSSRDGPSTAVGGPGHHERQLPRVLSPTQREQGLHGPHTEPASLVERKRVDLELRGALSQVARLKEQLEAENVYLRAEVQKSQGFEEIVGESPALLEVLDQALHVASTEVGVLHLGETGTGKDVVARLLHARSPRAQRPFVKVDCAALSSTLIESEFFGHEKGAFTGAVAQTTGRFELADGGTVFLDEIGDLPLELQAKLLRVLQDGQFERLGSARTRRTDVRVIAATNQDLEHAVESGVFRADLFYRLNVFPITLPPLRDRPTDIPLLVWHFIEQSQGKLHKRIERVPAAVMDALVAYDWPGNVRELQNVVERAVILSPDAVLRVEASAIRVAQRPESAPVGRQLSDVERDHIARIVAECGWRIRGAGNAAERLGINPSTLRSRMKKLGITRPGR